MLSRVLPPSFLLPSPPDSSAGHAAAVAVNAPSTPRTAIRLTRCARRDNQQEKKEKNWLKQAMISASCFCDSDSIGEKSFKSFLRRPQPVQDREMRRWGTKVRIFCPCSRKAMILFPHTSIVLQSDSSLQQQIFFKRRDNAVWVLSDRRPKIRPYSHLHATNAITILKEKRGGGERWRQCLVLFHFPPPN